MSEGMKLNRTRGCGHDVCGIKYISHAHKFIYFEVPKAGTSSLLNLFNEHAPVTKLRGRFTFLDYPEYLSFALVRNPWDRVLSCYLDKIKKDESFENDKFEKGVMKKFRKFGVFYAGMPFSEFLEAVGDIPDEIADGHFASQHKRLIMEGKIVVDVLGKFENYIWEVTRFLQRVGMKNDIEIPHLRKSKNRKSYPEYYDERTRKIVDKRFAEDIGLFGYRF